jgi:aspartate 1-decarboxylase
MLSAKIHRATVTGADLGEVESITLDGRLLQEANILPGEKVQVVNVNNGNRWETYVREGEADSRVIQVNGAGARLVSRGDILILWTLAEVEEPIPADFRPRVVFVDDENRLTEVLDMSPYGHPPRVNGVPRPCKVLQEV